jgi:hypothetical protein
VLGPVEAPEATRALVPTKVHGLGCSGVPMLIINKKASFNGPSNAISNVTEPNDKSIKS